MYKNLVGTDANGITPSTTVNNSGKITMYVGGVFGGASVQIGFTHPKGKQAFYPIPDVSTESSDFIKSVDFASGMVPSISITGATGPTDLEVIINRGG